MKTLFSFILGFLCLFLSGQNISDVLRYGLEDTQGTARFQAMGGAFGALGGDLSSLNVNPAGSAVFNYGQFTISGSGMFRNNEAMVANGFGVTSENDFSVNQAGGVFVYKSPNSPWKKFALAINYDMVNNFDSEINSSTISGTGLDQYFLNYAQGIPFGDILLRENETLADAYLNIGTQQGFVDQQAFLGYFGGIIDPVDANDVTGISYQSNAQYQTVNQDYYEFSQGYNSKFTLNLAGQYQENLFVGMGLNFHSVFYERLSRFTETGYDTASEIQRSTFDNLLQTEGAGFSFSLGAIARVNEALRLGASYQSPTWYRLEDNTSQRVGSTLEDTEIDQINFNLVNIFAPYTVQTPGKLTGSAALVFGKEGLLSFDYAYQDFSSALLRPNDGTFTAQNQFIASQLGELNSYRLGGEYRIDQVSLRAGYRFENSPYLDDNIMGDLTAYSGGIGLDFGGSKLDLAYTRASRDMNVFFFDSGIDNSVMVNQINTNVTLTYTLKF